MGQITLMYKINLTQMANCESMTATELAKELDKDSKRASALQKGQLLEEKPGRREAKLILREVEATLGSTFATNEEKKNLSKLGVEYGG